MANAENETYEVCFKTSASSDLGVSILFRAGSSLRAQATCETQNPSMAGRFWCVFPISEAWSTEPLKPALGRPGRQRWNEGNETYIVCFKT